jgi:hypothetical protein
MRRILLALLLTAVAATASWAVLAPAGAGTPPPGVITRWEHVTKADGLPDDRVFAVLAAPEGVYAGTEKGLALLVGGRVTRTWGEADGLSFPVVTSLCRDERTGAVFAGTMGGVTRIADGKATAIHQSPTGLVNDVVFSVCMENRNLWVATAAGLSRWDLDADRWDSWTEKNSPMKEIWCYSVCHDAGKVYVAVWGSGLLERDVATGAWNLYLDPDRDMRFDLFRHDGLLSDVAIAVSARRGTVWVASYLGLSRYDGRDWTTWVEEDSGLASSFINGSRVNGGEFWACTDKGLSQRVGDRWATHRRAGAGGEVVVRTDSDAVAKRYATGTGLPDDFVWAIDFEGRDVWVGTSGGLAHGFRNGPVPPEPDEGRRP